MAEQLMTERLQVYRCAICGNIVEVLHGGTGQLWCCGLPMKLLAENSESASTAKHTPVVRRTKAGVTVRVGSTPHPKQEHHVQWIEVIAGRRICRQHLRRGEEPKASFAVDAEGVRARAYCNRHGLWASA